jgi:hypothetical protein
MLLERQDAELFFRLHQTLMFFVNERLKVIPDKLATPGDISVLSPEVRLKVRDALNARLDLIESFVNENPARLSADELDIVHSWRHLVAGHLCVYRELKKYTVFLTTTNPVIAYGVLGLAQSLEEMIGPDLPVLTQTVLLPFKGKIVYDGLMTKYNISYGPGIRRSLNESFKEAKLRHGIVTSLPMSDKPMIPRNTPKPKSIPRTQLKDEKDEALGVIIRLIDQFCKEQLNEEYAVLCRTLAEKLAAKRPSPLLSGSPNTWASGIVRTVGWVNFLHDKSQTPHMRLSDIDAGFGISESSGAAKLAAIRKMLRIHQLDPNWTLPSSLDSNPLAWMLEVNGFTIDVRHAPREVQEIAFKKGLIPYIPADRKQGDQTTTPVQPRKMSEILKEMSEIVLRDPNKVPTSEAAHVALFFANAAWNESVGITGSREGYRNVWETIEAENPALWNEFKSNDVNAVIDELVQYKHSHYPDDQRRILTCGIPDGKIRVEWLKAAAPGVDSQWELRLYGLVRMGERDQAIRFLQETRSMSRNDAANKVVAVAVELGLK